MTWRFQGLPDRGRPENTEKAVACVGEGGGVSGRTCRMKSVRECMEKHLCRSGSADHRLSGGGVFWSRWGVSVG